MHIDQLGIDQYRIRKLEIVLEIIRDAESCASIYVKASLTRGIMERMLELEIANVSLAGLLLLVAKHHDQDRKFLERVEKTETDPQAIAVVKNNREETIKLRDKCLADAAAAAAGLAADDPARLIYDALRKSDSVEARAKALFPAGTAAEFYREYAALSQFVHGGNRETLMVTNQRGDLTGVLRPMAEEVIAKVKRYAEEQLAALRREATPAAPPRPDPVGYDQLWQFRRITSDNWLNADVPGYFPGVRPSGWINSMLAPQLDKPVPLEIVRLFEVSRGALVYSWFFYPLATLAAEQGHRVVEAAVKLRCEQLGRPARTFEKGIEILRGAGLISAEELRRWDATRDLRNSASHPKRQTIWDPGQAVQIFEQTASMLNGLFVGIDPGSR